jgi:peptidoglycan hydrolase CwlO-like protein
MAKALKPLIVVLLVLSLTSLILGVMLFSKRESLKGRADKSVAAFQGIAQKLRYESLDVAAVSSYGTMDNELAKLTTAAGNTVDELDFTKKDLADTKTTLETTKADLSAAKKTIEQKETDIAQLNQRIETKDRELDEAKGKSEQLEEEKQGLQAQINDMNDKMAQTEDANRDLQDKIVTLEQTLRDLEAQLGGGGTPPLPKGLTGKILVVNKDWNFVVISIGSENNLVPNAEMLIHRNDKLVGKVKISAVSKTLSIAEIVDDWAQSAPQEGDYVVY